MSRTPPPNPLRGAESVPLVHNFPQLFMRRGVLGQGSFGVTELLESTKTGDLYALKIMLNPNVDVLLEEVGALQNLSKYPACSSRIVCYYGVIAIPYTPAPPCPGIESEAIGDLWGRYTYGILSQYVAGGTLQDLLGPFDLPTSIDDDCEAFRIALSLMKAVYAVHAHKYAHRDLKPENIGLASPESTEVILLDFGLACDEDPKCRWPSRTGTAVYMAPEVYERAPASRGFDALRAWQAADVYSLGVIVYQIYQGRGPFVNWFAFIRGTEEPQRQPVALIARVGPCFNDIVQRMLDVNPRRRPTMAQVLLAVQKCPEAIACSERDARLPVRPFRDD